MDYRRLVPRLCWTFAALAAALVLSTPLRFWDRHGVTLLPSSTFAWISCLVVAVVLTFVYRRRPLEDTLVSVGILSLAALVLGDWIGRPYSLLPGSSFRGEILVACVVASFLLSRRASSDALRIFAPGAVVGLLGLFLLRAAGRPIFSDDHPVFFFRLSLLKEMFPQIPFYFPGWNAGLDARDFFATGALNAFFLTSPLVYLTDLGDSYNLIVALLVFVLPAGATWYATTVLRLPSMTGPLAALLSVATSLSWYRWALKYGTMGFITSTALAPILVVWTIRLLRNPRDISRREISLVVATTSLTLMWSLSGIALLPLVAWGIWNIKTLIASPPVRWILGAILVLNLPWIIAFISVSRVFSYVAPTPKVEVALREEEETVEPAETDQQIASPSEAKDTEERRGKVKPITAERTLKLAKEGAITFNPLILCLAIPGIFFVGSGRWIYLSLTAWLIALGTVLPNWKPQLELDRMFQILGMILTVPCALSLSRILELGESPETTWRARTGASLVLALTLLSPFIAANIIENHSLERYFVADSVVSKLAKGIETFGGNGRTVFSGFVLHELSHGHLAPLPLLSKKPLIASSPFHDKWKYTNVVPRSFMERGDAGIEEYLDLVNATAVVAHEPQWLKYFLTNRERYTRKLIAGRFSVFERHHESRYVLDGDATIDEIRINGVKLTPKSEDITLSFTYFPFLVAEGCTVVGRAYGDLELVRLTQCKPGRSVFLTSVPLITRILRHGK